MFRRVVARLIIAVLAGAVVAVSLGLVPKGVPLVLAGGPGGDPDSALPIPSGPVTIPAGQRVWYGFKYAGDASPIFVEMAAVPGGSANFSVWTPGNVRDWQSGQRENPVGRGSPQYHGIYHRPDGTVDRFALYNGALIWTGSFRSPGTYYVAVDPAGPVPATIDLAADGAGVTAIPGPVRPAVTPVRTTAPTAPACTPLPPPVKLSPAGPGGSPAQAVPLPSTATYLLPAGQRAWFAFQYNGDGSPIMLDLRGQPNSAGFAVYNSGDLNNPFGRGSQQTVNRVQPDGSSRQDTLYFGDLIWSGSSRVNGTYYVAVDQAFSGSGTITFGISGRGVGGGQPTSALPGSSAPPPACAAPQPTSAAPPTAAPTGARYAVKSVRLRGVNEGEQACTKGDHAIIATVVDTTGKPIDGVSVHEVWTNTTHVTDETGTVEWAIWKNGGGKLQIVDDGGQPLSPVTREMSNAWPDVDLMMAAGYCACESFDQAACAAALQSHSRYFTFGHYVYEVVFQRTS